MLKSQNLPPSDACFTTSVPKPKAKPTPVAISNVNPIPKCPVGLYLLTGSLPQYAYRFSPLILSGSKYSIESGEIHLHNSGE